MSVDMGWKENCAGEELIDLAGDTVGNNREVFNLVTLWAWSASCRLTGNMSDLECGTIINDTNGSERDMMIQVT